METETSQPRVLSENEVRLIINQTGYTNTSYPELLINAVNEEAPVLGRFLVKTVPEGFAPESIRRDWVGLSLPVRCQDDVYPNELQPILAIDAILALKESGKDEAYQWWMSYYEDEWKRAPGFRESFPDFLAYVDFLQFDSSNGQLEWETPSQAE